MGTQIKEQNQLIRELITFTKESLSKNPAAVEVGVHRNVVRCFINIMKPKLENVDVA